MTDTYLRSLGFAPTTPTTPLTFGHAWRYRADHVAGDGAQLFIEHPIGIAHCRLSALAAPLAMQDVFASIGLHDQPALEVAITAFYAAHGGVGPVRLPAAAATFRPYRRER